jgi:hypothetical protein
MNFGLVHKASSGLINNVESHLYTWNISSNLAKAIANIFKFSYDEKWKSFKYLGIHIILKFKFPHDEKWKSFSLLATHSKQNQIHVFSMGSALVKPSW